MALPQFSRNYGRSGAYESPQTVVDTKSGAIWANAINNIGSVVSNTFTSLAKIQSEETKQTQKYLDDNAKFVIQQYDSFLENTKTIGLKNPSYSEAALYAIRKKGEAYFGMRKGDKEAEKNYSKWTSKLSELIEYGKAGVAANESFDADYISAYDKVNTPGGISTVGVDPVRSKNYSLAMPVRTGTTKNPKETWYFDENDNIRIRYNSDQISKAHANGELEKEYVDTTPLSLFTFDAGKIDDIRKDMVGFYNEAAILKNNVLGKGYVLNEVKTISSSDGKTEYDFQEINKPAITASTKSYISSKAKSYLKRPSAVNNLWIHTLNQGKNIKDANGKQKYPEGLNLKLSEGVPGTAFDEQSSKVFTEALAQYMYDILPEGKQGSVRKIYKDTGDKPSVSEKRARDAKNQAPQVYSDMFNNTESYFKNRKINGKDIVEVRVVPGSVPSGDAKVAPVIELGYRSGTTTKGGEQTIFTNDMVFDLSNPARVRTLIDMLDENDDLKKELKNLVTENPVDAVSIEEFVQKPLLPGLQ